MGDRPEAVGIKLKGAVSLPSDEWKIGSDVTNVKTGVDVKNVDSKYKIGGGGKCLLDFDFIPKYSPSPFTFNPKLKMKPGLWFEYKAGRFEYKADYESIRGFINERVGREILPKESDYPQWFKALVFTTVKVMQGKPGDGKIRIRITTRTEVERMSLPYKTVPTQLFGSICFNFFTGQISSPCPPTIPETITKIRDIVISADGNIFEEGAEDKTIASISPEDASALIAILYGKEELGGIKPPSDRHIDSVRKMLLPDPDAIFGYPKNFYFDSMIPLTRDFKL